MLAVSIALGLSVTACGPMRPPAAATPAAPIARYLDGFALIPETLKVPGSALAVGSLSGLARDTQSDRWVAASDAAPPRLVWLDIDTARQRLAVTPTAYTMLTAAPGLAHPEVLRGLDMESLVVMPDGSFVTTNEGHTDRTGVVHQPAVIFARRDGQVVDVVFPRPHFLVTKGETTHGVRHNLGLESLTRTPDGRLLSGMEQPLAQDGPVSSTTAGGRVRLVEFVPAGATWRPGREWVYPLEPTARVRGYSRACQDGDNGLSEMLALDDHRVVMVERACLADTDRPALNPVRLYVADVEGADDVSGVEALGSRPVRMVKKRLLADLVRMRGAFPPRLRTLSNFEGLAFGPAAPGAPETLLLVSDDNFRASQTLAFLWLSLPRP